MVVLVCGTLRLLRPERGANYVGGRTFGQMEAVVRVLRLLKSPIWYFSLRSFFTAYGQLFLWHMALAHPKRFGKALVRLPSFLTNLIRDGFVTTGSPKTTGYDLVAGSFCQKPFACPAGRFNHRCLKAEAGSSKLPRICEACPLGRVADLAAVREADFYVMTSALDIAHDLFLPNLRVHWWHRGLFILCPYSAQPFLLAMLVAGFEGTLVTFCCGDCRNYRDFSLADRGVKPQQTQVAPHLWHRFVGARTSPTRRFAKRGSVYVHLSRLQRVDRGTA